MVAGVTPSNTVTVPKIASIGDYFSIVGHAEVDEIHALAAKLSGKTVKMVNSTSVGGGVAEILNRLVPLMEEVGLKCEWNVVTGGDDFFEVTKAFHNALHGAPYDPPQRAFDVFLSTTEQNLQHLQFDSDFVVIHDPQPAGLIKARKPGTQRWIWRCHIDVSNPNPQVWNFLMQFVPRYDGVLISSPSFSRR